MPTTAGRPIAEVIAEGRTAGAEYERGIEEERRRRDAEAAARDAAAANLVLTEMGLPPADWSRAEGPWSDLRATVEDYEFEYGYRQNDHTRKTPWLVARCERCGTKHRRSFQTAMGLAAAADFAAEIRAGRDHPCAGQTAAADPPAEDGEKAPKAPPPALGETPLDIARAALGLFTSSDQLADFDGDDWVLAALAAAALSIAEDVQALRRIAQAQTGRQVT